MAKEKVTLNITGIDSDGDDALDLSQPQKIYRIYDTLSEAEADIAATDFSAVDEDLIVFVRDVAVHATIPASDFLSTESYSIADAAGTVIKTIAKGSGLSYTFSDPSMAIGSVYTVTATLLVDSTVRSFKITAVGQALDDTDGHVGFFYSIDKDTPKLGDPLIIGGHTHINPQILDQITDIDPNSLTTGEENILVLVKKDDDSSDVTSKYELKWLNRSEFENAFSDLGVPASSSSPSYLTATADGLGWTNEFLPNTLFRRYTKTLVADDISNDGKTVAYTYSADDKTYHIDTANDELLAFDGGTLIDDATISSIDGGFAVTTSASGTFEAGETVTFVAVRNGVSGILDAINDEYLTKADAVKMLSDGSVTLNDYALKDTLSEYALKVHYHGQYSLKGHNHDGRYAPYQHTHYQYMTKADVLNVLAQCAESSESDTDLLNAVKTLAEQLQAEYSSLLGNLATYVTADQLETTLNAFKADAGNSITSPIIGAGGTYVSLNDALSILQAGIAANAESIRNLSSVKDTAVKVTATRTAHIAVGGIAVGDEIKRGESLNDLLSKMFPTKKAILPSITVMHTEAAKVEVGQVAIYNIALVWNPGGIEDYEAGTTTANAFRLATIDVFAGDSNIKSISRAAGDFTCELGKSATVSFQTSSFQAGSDPVIVAVVAGYGKSSAASTLRYEFTVTPERLIFAGTLASEITSSTDLTTDDFSDNIRTLYEFYKDDAVGFTVSSAKKSKTLVIAIPDSANKKPTKVVYTEQGIDIFDMMAKRTGAEVAGDNDYADATYTIYYYIFDEAASTDMTFDVTLEDTEAS